MDEGPRSAVVVTGASGGIGLATGRALVARGFTVFGSHLPAEDAAPLKDAGLVPFALDVTDLDGTRAACGGVLAALGDAPLHGLVNNAGIAEGGPIEMVDLAAVRACLLVNVLGPFAVTQALLPRLRASRGRVVNVSSVSGRLALPFTAPYSASKFAVEAFSDCLRRECLPFGVEVVVIQPAIVKTAIWDRAEREDMTRYGDTPWNAVMLKVRKRMLRAKRKGLEPEEVAAAVVRALTASRPPTRIPVLRKRSRYVLAGLLPDRVVDRFVARELWP